MSANGNGWKPRKTAKVTCPSGQEVYVRRPGPELALRAGRVARTFTKLLPKNPDELEQLKDKSPEEVIMEMSDEELASLTIFARELVVAMMVSPKLVLNPNPERDEIGPDDVGDDFWFLFNYGMQNFYGIKVPVGESEVEVKDLETFREEPGVSGDSVDSLHLPVEVPERETTDQGLVDSAGA